MPAPLTPEQAFARAAARCAQREYCRADWCERFVRAGLPRAACEQVLDRLEDEGYIDEARYARAFAHDKVRYERWGRIKIAAALSAKRLATAAIDEALGQIDDAEYRAAFLSAVQTKLRSMGYAPLPEASSPWQAQLSAADRARLVRFLASRGFEPANLFQTLGGEADGF